MSYLADIPWLRVLGESLVKSTLVLACGLGFMRLLRHRTASLRHFVLFLFLVGLLFLPLLSISPAGWETRLWPSVPGGRPWSPAPSALRPEPLEFGPIGSDSGESGRGIAPSGRQANTASAPGSGGAAPRLPLWAKALPALWLAVFLLLLLRLAAGLGKAVRLTKESETVDEPVWRVLIARCLSAVRLKRRVRLKSHPEVSVPLTWGVRKPVVLIPASHRGWTVEQRSAALVHELCHVKRADFLALVLVRLTLAVFWFNPLCWLALRRLKKEQEKACDEMVLRAGLKPSTYAANLLFFKRAAGVRWPASVALVGAVGGSPFQDRLASILKQTPTFQEVRMKTKLFLVLSPILAIGLIGLARPSTAAADAVAALNGPAIVAEAFSQAGTAADATGAASQEKTAEAQEQQKKKEEQEKKAAKTTTVMIETKEGKKIPLEVTIVYGDEAKMLKVDKSLTVKKDDEGNLIIVTADGKDIKISKSEPFRLEVKSGELTLIKEGKTLKIDKGNVLVTKKLKEGAVTFHVLKPAIKIMEAKEGEIKSAHGVLKVGETIEPSVTYVTRRDLSGIRAKLRELREKLKRAKEEKLDLEVIIEELAELESKLEEKTEEGAVRLKLETRPRAIGIVTKPKSDSITLTVESQEDSFSIAFGLSSGEMKRETYDRVVERVKSELPEGYALDPSLDEEKGIVILKVTGPAGKEPSEKLAKKMSEVIQEEVKRAKK